MTKHFTWLAVLLVLFASLISCSKDNPDKEPEEPKVPMVFESTYRGLNVGTTVPIKGENLDGISWQSSPFFVSEIDPTQHIITKHVGLSWHYYKDFELFVEVTPRYKDYDLPVICQTATYQGIIYETYANLFHSAGISSVMEYEKEEYGRSLDPRSTNSMLIYRTGNIKSPYVSYFFKNSTLDMCGTLIDPSYLSNLPEFLTERYEVSYVDVITPAAYFIHKAHTKEHEEIDYIGGLQYFSQLGGVLLAFMEYTGAKSLSAQDNIQECMQEFAHKFAETLSGLNTDNY